MSQQMDDATERAINQIQKLMKLAGNNPNENEAASALAKAQELLAAYNLDMALVEAKGGTTGKRADEQIAGGMHKYSRNLWSAIAELNWCRYWTMKVLTKPGSAAFKRKRRFTHEHRLVGRVVNIASTKAMGGYLEHTIERLCRERLASDGGIAHKQFYSSWAVAFREGVADRVIEKIRKRRGEIIEEEERKAREAGRDGVSTATSLTVAGLAESEEAGNYDFLNGEGAWARKKAREAEWEKEWAERLQRQAEAQAAAEKEYAEWAAAHPEEAAAAAEEERKKERAREKRASRRTGRRYSFRQTKEDMRRESGGYYAGYDAGANVSIDPQMDSGSRRRIA